VANICSTASYYLNHTAIPSNPLEIDEGPFVNVVWKRGQIENTNHIYLYNSTSFVCETIACTAWYSTNICKVIRLQVCSAVQAAASVSTLYVLAERNVSF